MDGTILGKKYDLMNEGGGGGGASSADDVSFDPTDSGLTATNVQDAIDEVSANVDTALTSFTSGEKDTGITWINNKRLYRQTAAVTIADLTKSIFTSDRTAGEITSLIPADADEVFIDVSHSAIIFNVDVNVLKSVPVEYIASDGKYVRTQILNVNGWQIYFDATFAAGLLYDNASDITLIVTVFYTKTQS